ncbi:hyalin repeat protein [unidentified eubacterium SCB49]|nr:hyalin repeat protein [unidentified eubacterium SCB49]
MNKITQYVFVFIMCFLSTLNAQEENSFTSLNSSGIHNNGNIAFSNQLTKITPIQTRAVTSTFTDRDVFQAECSNLSLENFAGGAGAGQVISCNEISSAGSACFPANEIIPGFTVTSNSGNVVVLGLGVAYGNTSEAVGADLFTSYTIITFTDPDVVSVGMDILSYSGSAQIRVFDALGVLTDTFQFSNTSNSGDFYGIIADSPIGRIEIEATNSSAEVFENLEFGACVTANAEPVAVCQDITVQLDATGNVTITAEDVDGGSTDLDDDVLSFSVDVASFGCDNIGPNQVILTVDDGNGGTDTCMATVTIEDNIAPVIECVLFEELLANYPFEDDIEDSTGTFGSAYLINGAVPPTIDNPLCFNNTSDSDGLQYGNTPNISTLDLNKFTFSIDFNMSQYQSQYYDTYGTNIIMLSYSYRLLGITELSNGNFGVIHNNNITIDSEILLESEQWYTAKVVFNQGDLKVFLNDQIVVDEFIGDLSVTTSLSFGTRNWSTGSNLHGCIRNLSVSNLVSEANVDTDANSCTYTVQGDEFDATFIDNCTTTVITNDFNMMASLDGAVLPLGETSILWTVDDGNGQIETCTTTIVVEDNTAPIITCPSDQTVDVDTDCAFTVPDFTDLATATDNCGTPSMTQTPAIGTVLPIGTTVVTLIADDGNGQTSECTFTLTVEDNTAPIITCPSDQTVDVDTDCAFIVPDFTSLATATDNCGTPTMTQTPIIGTVLSTGTTVVTLTADDGNGQTSECTFTLTVEDNTAPVITCPSDQTVDVDTDCEFTVPDFTSLATATDNCGTPTITQSPAIGTVLSAGTTVITLTADDGNGQTSECTFTLTVEDNIAPVITCPSDQTVDAEESTMMYELPDYWATGDATATDNCTDPVITSQDPAAGTLVPVGVQIVTLTATDDADNEVVCSFNVTVEEVLGVEDVSLDINSITMFPNPAKDIINLSNPSNILIQEVSVRDMLGRVIISKEINNTNIVNSINVSTLSNATYMVIITIDGAVTAKQLIKK